MDRDTRKFSWTLFMNNTFPQIGQNDNGDPGRIGAMQKDMFYTYQLGHNGSPLAWDEGCIVAAGILDISDKRLSTKGFEALRKSGVLNADNEVDTTKISKHFVKELYMIPVFRQKQMVDLLFWWEEESHRLRKLLQEQAELQHLLQGAKGEGKAEEAECYGALLKRVQGKIAARPSDRTAAVEQDQDHELKTVTARLQDLVSGGGDVRNDAHHQRPLGEELPRYSA